jgi:hypothetical protein
MPAGQLFFYPFGKLQMCFTLKIAVNQLMFKALSNRMA